MPDAKLLEDADASVPDDPHAPPEIDMGTLDEGDDDAPEPTIDVHDFPSEAVACPLADDLHREEALCTVDLGGDTLIYYRDRRFVAVCRRDAHQLPNRCRLERSAEGSGYPSRSAQGRPLGLMAAWLLYCNENDAGVSCENKEEHISLFFLCCLDHATRMRARRHILTLPGGAQLAAYERPRRLAQLEPEEPIDFA